jgi:pimeloyl-ACP methyl ester carboxylesterase
VQFDKIAEAGHWIHAEKPKETLKIITSFFH